MTEETSYREGEDKTVPAVAAVPEQSVAEDMPEAAGVSGEPAIGTKEVPALLSVLLVQRPDGVIEATTNLPGIVTTRTATLRDVRDMCHSMFCDLQSTMVAQNSAQETTGAFNKLLQKQAAAKSAIITPGV